jgi:hypothetical protein
MGDTALHWASASLDPKNPLLPKGYQRLVTMLLEGNADPNIVNRIGQHAIYRASQRGNHAVAEMLVAAGADLSIVDRQPPRPRPDPSPPARRHRGCARAAHGGGAPTGVRGAAGRCGRTALDVAFDDKMREILTRLPEGEGGEEGGA